jgi:hypothetical protein
VGRDWVPIIALVVGVVNSETQRKHLFLMLKLTTTTPHRVAFHVLYEYVSNEHTHMVFTNEEIPEMVQARVLLSGPGAS